MIGFAQLHHHPPEAPPPTTGLTPSKVVARLALVAILPEFLLTGFHTDEGVVITTVCTVLLQKVAMAVRQDLKESPKLSIIIEMTLWALTSPP